MLETAAPFRSTASAPVTPATSPVDADSYVIVHGVTWGAYCAVRELLDRPGLRMAYLEGTLEIMSPSQRHEFLKKQIGRLLETYAIDRDVPLTGYGSATFRKEARERGAEPDECYCVGHEVDSDEIEAPDIAIEVVLTSGGLDKLRIYAGLGVREVWFWCDDAFQVFVLDGEDYKPVPASTFLPELDVEQLAGFVRMPNQHQAVVAFRDLLRV